MVPWCSGYHYCTTSINKAWTQVLRRFIPCSRRVGDSRWWGSLTVVPAVNKAKPLSSVNHTTKTIHHHHLHHRLNLDKALLLPRNQTICLKNWNFWRASTATKFSIFCWNFARVSYLTMSTKGCSGFFCFVNKFNKNLKNECVETRSFLFLKITQDLNKIINIPNTLL